MNNSQSLLKVTTLTLLLLAPSVHATPQSFCLLTLLEEKLNAMLEKGAGMTQSSGTRRPDRKMEPSTLQAEDTLEGIANQGSSGTRRPGR